MDIHVGDVLKMKKAHPCGSQEWLVLRVGMDFRMRCLGCGHEVMLPRNKAEKSVRKVYRDGTEVKLEARPAKGGQGGGEEASINDTGAAGSRDWCPTPPGSSPRTGRSSS